jgi:hypothetical protein
MKKIIVVILIVSILFVYPTNAGNSDFSESGGIEPTGGLYSYGDYIEITGDGHMHTSYSSGSSTVHEMAKKAVERGLDWIFITDGNTIAGKQNCTEETNGTFICGIGQEVMVLEETNWTNEIIAWGIDSLVDWHTDENRTVGDIIDDIHVQGGVAYIPHPEAPEPDDDYDYFGVYDNFEGMSIYHGYYAFNDFFSPMDGDALRKWDEYLDNGFRKTALGESDCKNANNEPDYGNVMEDPRGAIGFPRNYIYANEFSVRGMIEAVRHGRSYLSDGPTMNFTIDGHIMGDTIYSEVPISLNINISGNAIEDPSTVSIWSNGSEIYSQSVSAGPFSITHNYLANNDTYFRIEIRTAPILFPPQEEYNVAFSNPIYFDLLPYEELPLPPTDLEAWINGTDVVLNWTSSASSDVMHYYIYRSDTPDGFDFTYPHALTAKTMWIDRGAGEGDANSYFYVVRAVDKALYNDTNTVIVGKYAQNLKAGWNLISTPLLLSNNITNFVLQTINDSCEVAYYYDASDSLDHWKDTKSGDLTEINNTMALWVYLNSSDYLITAGMVPSSTDIVLYPGWNLVGYPSFESRFLGDALTGLNWERVEYYDPTNITGDFWKVNSTAKPGFLNDLDMMVTGRGYWIFVTDKIVWIVNS